MSQFILLINGTVLYDVDNSNRNVFDIKQIKEALPKLNSGCAEFYLENEEDPSNVDKIVDMLLNDEEVIVVDEGMLVTGTNRWPMTATLRLIELKF